MSKFKGYNLSARPVIMCSLALLASGIFAQSPETLGALRYRLIGPYRGGRSLAVTGVPGRPERFYFGAVGGGVWRTDNAGRTWSPVFDNEPTASIGWITVAPSNSDVIYVGSGEADMRGDIQQGNGMYRSIDAGKTWAHIGLEDTRQIGKILVDPKDSNTVYVAALGHQYGSNDQRGVFKTVNGGASWEKVLYKGPDVGAIDLDMDPTNSNVVYAALWNTRRPPWSVYPPSNGPGGGLFKSIDAGKTWAQIKGNGFPDFVGRVGVAVSPADHNLVYAFVDTNDMKSGGVYRSEDAGETWKYVDGETRIWFRGWYFGGITADPKDRNTVYVMNTSTYRSTDGGQSFTPIKGAPGGDDYHTMWIYPSDPDRMILGCDQGTVISVDGGKTWSSWYNQPTGQFYHVITDNRFPYWIYGAQQDSGAMAVPSRSIHSGISMMDWRPIEVGGESDTISPDPLDPGTILGSDGSKERLDTAWVQSNDPAIARNDTIWRNEWTHPIARSPIDPKVVYTAHQEIFRSGDGGITWKSISPDLSRDRGGVNLLPNLNEETEADVAGFDRRGLVYWIAPSPVKLGEVWAGTDDGYVWLTTDDGGHWHNVTPPDVPDHRMNAWSKVGVIDASPYDADTAYVAIDRHRLDDNRPYIYSTHDAGRTWRLIVSGIPSGEFVNVVREDPIRKGLLYAGTDWQVYYSVDDGDHWQSLKLNLPDASIRDIVFNGNDVIVGTHGRAIWVLDDPAPLRENISTPIAPHLFSPGPAYLFQRASSFGEGAFDEGTPLPPEEPQGVNPPWGAVLDYYLPPGTRGPVSIIFKDLAGKVVATVSSSDPPRPVDLKKLDIPAYWVKPAPTVETEAGAHRYVWNLRDTESGDLLPPGAYTVSLQAGLVTGNEDSRPLTVVRDPRLKVSDEDLKDQYAFSKEVWSEIAVVKAAASQAENMMRQAGNSLPADKKAKLQTLVGTGNTFTPDIGGLTDQDADSLRHIEDGLNELRRAVNSAPSAPTAEHRHAYDVLRARAQTAIAELKELRGEPARR